MMMSWKQHHCGHDVMETHANNSIIMAMYVTDYHKKL